MKQLQQSEAAATVAPEATAPSFPSVRYFQIHFQYLQEIIGELKTQVDQANRQIAELQRQVQVRDKYPAATPAAFGEEQRRSAARPLRKR